MEGWAPPAATQKAQILKSTPCSCVLQTLEVTVAFYITRRTSSSYFCAGACDGNMVSLLKGYPRVTADADWRGRVRLDNFIGVMRLDGI